MPLLMATLTCVTVKLNPSNLDLKNPNFQLGRTQAAVSSFVLVFCFIGILQKILIYIFNIKNIFQITIIMSLCRYIHI